MFRHRYNRNRRFLLFVFSCTVALSAVAWQQARMQSTVRRITNTNEVSISANPSISGDGRTVAFESTADIIGPGSSGAFRAIRANVEPDPASFLPLGSARAPAAAISQDGSHIAFASKENPLGTNNDGNSEIFLFDSGRLTQITNTSPGDISNRIQNGNFQPSISDDGRFLAFSSNRDLANQNADGNLEIFIFDSVSLGFTQLTDSSGIVGASDAKLSGNGANVAYIRDSGATASADRSLLLQSRAGPPSIRTLATNATLLAMTYGRAISDDGERVVWSTQTATNTTQVFLFDGRNDNTVRQITALGSRSADVPLLPSISGDGSKISFATRRTVLGPGTNSDSSVELYAFDIPSGTVGRVTNVNDSHATAEVVSSMNDDGSLIAFNFSRLLSGPVSHDIYENNSEIYLSGTPPRPVAGNLTILNRASFGREPSTTKAVAPDSIAVALGGSLAFTTRQAQRQSHDQSDDRSDKIFPTIVAGTTVTVNGQPAQILFVSPNEVHFHVPATTALGNAEIVVTNSDGFQSTGNVSVLPAAPGIFTDSGDGLGDGTILNADTMQAGPFDPTNGSLRLIVFATGVRNATAVSVTAGGRALSVETILQSSSMPGMDEIHVLVPADLRGAGKLDLFVRANGRDSNPAGIEFAGDSQRDVLINEFLADPPDGANGDANRDGVRDSAQDEFIELVNTTTHDINISGYRIFTRGTGADTQRHLFAAGTILSSCRALVVFGGGESGFNPNDPAFGGALVLKASSGSLSLVNSGGTISLQDQSGAVVNLVSYGGSSGIDAGNNQSVTRLPDISGNFVQHQLGSGGPLLFSPGTQISGAAFSPCGPAVARVEVSPAATTISKGAQQQFIARAFDAGNNEVPGVLFSWQSSNTSVATIDQNGFASGVNSGSTEIRASGRGVQSAPAMLTVNPVAPPNVVINEVDSDQVGTDTTEFVEIYDGGSGNTSLSGLVVVFYNGADDKSYAAFDLDAHITNASGYFTLGNAAVPGVDQIFANGLMQNGADAIAIYVGNASDFPNGTSVTTVNLIDALVYDTADVDDGGLLVLLNSGQPQINEDNGGTGIANSNQRCPNGSGRARNTATYNQFAPTPDSANLCTVVTPPPTLTINDVSLNEGSAGPTAFTFTVSLSAPAPAGGVTFDITTADNTATVADNDYIAKNLPGQTITAGNQSYQFAVTVNGDVGVELDEAFFVGVTNVTGATIGDGQGLGTIQNDDTATLAISQLYGGGGNSGAQYRNDFVELFNRGTTTVDFGVTPYSVQYAGGSSNFGSSKVNLTSGSMAPGQYFLVQLSSGGVNGVSLPAPDASGSIAMAATAGKVALVSGTTSLTGSGCPLPATVADFVGYGTSANCFEGLGHAPAPGNTTAEIRKAGGCTDTNDNAADFLVSVPLPRNSASPFNTCVAATPPNVTINDVIVTEGNSGTTMATFTVSLSAPAPSTDITFDIATGDNSATTATGDYVARTLTNQIILAGRQSYTFTVAVNADSVIEPDETFFVNVTNLSGGTLTDGQGVGTIQNDDLPSLSINDVSQNETNSGTTTLSFAVGLSAPAPTAVTFDIATEDNTATVADSDYIGRSLNTQTIPEGSSNYTFDVTVNGDLAIEVNETFFVNITNVVGATVVDPQGIGTIQNDDSPALTISDASAIETNSGAISFTFTVTSSLPAPAGGITFDVSTADDTAHDGTPASDDNDYLAQSLTAQTITAGNTTYTFAVTVNGDRLVEPSEMFFVNLANATNASIVDGQGLGTIQNDDLANLVISQIYGGGGNTSATYTNDFIEIFNRGNTTVDFSVTPYSVQYSAATSTFSTNKTDITSGILLPGHYFLIQEASGGGNGSSLPAPDSSGTINLAATAGKVALVAGTTALTGSGCPLAVTVADFLGYGSSANCFETAPIAVSGTNSNARSVIRTVSCSDTNSNSTDFSNPTTPPVARNTATTPTICP